MQKLVRDRIPEIIEAQGKQPKIRVLSRTDYLTALKDKLQEEVDEFRSAPSLEELADVLEVLHALTQAMGHSVEDLERERVEKRDKRGAFDQRIWLEKVEDIIS